MPNNKGRRRRFGSIRKTDLGEFQASYLGPDGRRHFAPRRFKLQRDADRWLAKAESLLVAGDWTDPERAKVTVGEYAEQWIEQRPSLRPRTVALYRWLLQRYIEPGLGSVQLGALTPAVIRSWRSDLLVNGRCPRRWLRRRTGSCARCSIQRSMTTRFSRPTRAASVARTARTALSDRC